MPMSFSGTHSSSYLALNVEAARARLGSGRTHFDRRRDAIIAEELGYNSQDECLGRLAGRAEMWPNQPRMAPVPPRSSRPLQAPWVWQAGKGTPQFLPDISRPARHFQTCQILPDLPDISRPAR